MSPRYRIIICPRSPALLHLWHCLRSIWSSSQRNMHQWSVPSFSGKLLPVLFSSVHPQYQMFCGTAIRSHCRSVLPSLYSTRWKSHAGLWYRSLQYRKPQLRSCSSPPPKHLASMTIFHLRHAPPSPDSGKTDGTLSAPSSRSLLFHWIKYNGYLLFPHLMPLHILPCLFLLSILLQNAPLFFWTFTIWLHHKSDIKMGDDTSKIYCCTPQQYSFESSPLSDFYSFIQLCLNFCFHWWNHYSIYA